MRPRRSRLARLSRHRRRAAVLSAAVLVASAFTVAAGRPGQDRPGADRFHATCRTEIRGSRALAYCHNPYPETDRVRLHVDCARWWDIDTVGAAVDIPAAGYVRLADRCWKEIRSVRVSHERP
ncbi:hypothetical protein [Streptomyces sp. NPDC056987]|uniref:hypothetical protein n=1 Tax=Streptomyces sp. NPDC056987 TaxID=3345988 RepID=UPI00362D3CDB